MHIQVRNRHLGVITGIDFLGGKESACQCRRCWFDPWRRKIPWRRKWQSTPVLLPGESHGQRSLVSYSPLGLQRVRHDWMTNAFTFFHRWFVWKIPIGHATYFSFLPLEEDYIHHHFFPNVPSVAWPNSHSGFCVWAYLHPLSLGTKRIHGAILASKAFREPGITVHSFFFLVHKVVWLRLTNTTVLTSFMPSESPRNVDTNFSFSEHVSSTKEDSKDPLCFY